MRFISDSSASPAVSLERVQGAARLATKSPFSHLDAIYTYILSQADDQDALKDILCTQVLSSQVQKAEPDYNQIPLTDLLKSFNGRYTVPMVLSCLADLTSIAWYRFGHHELLFYHASFTDYLLDQSRSRDYFVDIAGFSYKILPVIWKAIHNGLHLIRSCEWIYVLIVGVV